jgi:hypothetical protein
MAPFIATNSATPTVNAVVGVVVVVVRDAP